MKRSLIILMTLLFAVSLNAQETLQSGITYKYNGKRPKTVLANVNIRTNASPTISGQNGAFTLKLKQSRMGDPIKLVFAMKSGYVLFNKDETESWSVKKGPLRLVMCDAATYNKMKSENYDKMLANLTAKHDREEKRLKAQLAQKRMKERDYKAKLDSITNLYDNSLSKLDEYVEEYTRIDESELDSVMSKAKQLFDEGEAEEAIKTLKSSHIVDDYIKTFEVEKEGKEKMAKIQEQIDNATEDRAKAKANILAQITMLKSFGQFNEAKALLKTMADNETNYENVFNYATFCNEQKDTKEAEKYYLLALDSLSRPNSDLRKKLTVMNKLGFMYMVVMNDFPRAEKVLLESLEESKKQVASDPATFEPLEATAMVDLGALYATAGKNEEGLKMATQSLEITRRLEKQNPEEYEESMSASLFCVGENYRKMNKFAESEKMLLDALKVQRKLVQKNYDAYVLNLRFILGSLGRLYRENNNIAECEKYYREEVEINRKLAKKNPGAYESSLAGSLSELGAILYDKSDEAKVAESKKLTIESIEIYRRIVTDNPDLYEDDLASSIAQLANIYANSGDYADQEKTISEAVEIFKKLTAQNPRKYAYGYASTSFNMCIGKYNLHKYAECKELALQAAEIYKQIAKVYPEYKTMVARSFNMASYSSMMAQDFASAQKYAEQAFAADSINYAKVNIAMAMLLQGNLEGAKVIYNTNKDKLRDSLLGDIADYEEQGIIPDARKADVAKMKELLNAK
jgi:hypothetical protein